MSLALFGAIGGFQAATAYIGHGIDQSYAPFIGITGATLLAIKATLSIGTDHKHQDTIKGDQINVVEDAQVEDAQKSPQNQI